MTSSSPAQRILVVEDEFINLKLIVETLDQYGFDLLTAQNGEEALFHATQYHPDLILLDIRMPGMDGLEVCKQLKSDPSTSNIPIIFLTALNDTQRKLQAFRLGGVDYITKPYDPQEVLARVILHLDQHRLQQRLLQRLEAYERLGLGALSESTVSTAEHAKGMVKLANYLRENLANNPSLDDLAQIASTNRTTLNQDFQRLYGLTVFDWLREQRLLKAAWLLRSSEKSVLEIAQGVGYASHAGFTTAFRLRFGLSPREYRTFDED